jgi:hypothetical protein
MFLFCSNWEVVGSQSGVQVALLRQALVDQLFVDLVEDVLRSTFDGELK